MTDLDLKTDVLPFIVATGGEFAALYFWLHFLDADRFVLANVLLWAGFLVERGSVILWLRFVYVPASGQSFERRSVLAGALGLFAITASEVAIWIGWLHVADNVSFALAAVLLMVLMLLEHSAEMSFVKKTGLLAFVTSGRTIFFTVMEVAGAVAWLYLWRSGEPMLGALCLLLGLTVEHVLQGSQLKPRKAEVPAAG